MFLWNKKKYDIPEIPEQHQSYFLSCRVREYNTDLRPLYDRLKKKEDTSVFTFIRDNNKSMIPDPVSPLIAFPPADERESTPSYSIICNDIAMRDFYPERENGIPQILLITPNNFFYQLIMKDAPDADDPKRLDLEKFSHILAPNQFIADIITRNYNLDSTQHLELLENPFHWNLCQEENINWQKEKFFSKYPQAKDKKILFLMMPQKTGKEQKEILGNFPLDDFLTQLGKDWFFITNCKPLLIRTMGMRKDYSEQFLYLNRQYPLEDILYFCDILVTDLSYLAVAQAQKNKPFFCLGHNDNAFEQYIKENHPTLFLETSNDLLSINDSSLELTKDHIKLYEELVYKQADDPQITLEKLLLAK